MHFLPRKANLILACRPNRSFTGCALVLILFNQNVTGKNWEEFCQHFPAQELRRKPRAGRSRVELGLKKLRVSGNGAGRRRTLLLSALGSTAPCTMVGTANICPKRIEISQNFKVYVPQNRCMIFNWPGDLNQIPFEHHVAITVHRLTHTPTPWLTRIRFMQLSLTQLFKRFPFLT